MTHHLTRHPLSAVLILVGLLAVALILALSPVGLAGASDPPLPPARSLDLPPRIVGLQPRVVSLSPRTRTGAAPTTSTTTSSTSG